MKGKYVMMLGFVMALIVITGCSSEKNNNNSLDVPTIEEVHSIPVTAEEDRAAAPSPEIDKDNPAQLRGSVEDEVLSVSMLAELDADNNYTAKVAFHNKTEASVELIYDCGLLISNDRFESDQRICLAVESMLLKKNQQETMIFTVSADFFDTRNDSIKVRYRQDRITTELEIQFHV